jgi:hypothetical protein
LIEKSHDQNMGLLGESIQDAMVRKVDLRFTRAKDAKNLQSDVIKPFVGLYGGFRHSDGGGVELVWSRATLEGKLYHGLGSQAEEEILHLLKYERALEELKRLGREKNRQDQKVTLLMRYVQDEKTKLDAEVKDIVANFEQKKGLTITLAKFALDRLDRWVSLLTRDAALTVSLAKLHSVILTGPTGKGAPLSNETLAQLRDTRYQEATLQEGIAGALADLGRSQGSGDTEPPFSVVRDLVAFLGKTHQLRGSMQKQFGLLISLLRARKMGKLENV